MTFFDHDGDRAIDTTLAVLMAFVLSLALLGLAGYYSHKVDVVRQEYDQQLQQTRLEISKLNSIIAAKDNRIEALRRKVYTVQRELAYLRSEVDRLNLAAYGPKVTRKVSGYAIVTAYTAYHESTGKNPGDKGFNITRSGVPGGYGVCAADPRYWEFGTVLYIEGLGACVILDTGGAIKGKWRFDYMFGGERDTAVKLALQWGRRLTKVWVISN